MEKGWSFPVADNMNPEAILSLKENFQSYILKRPHLKHFSFDEFLSIAKHCKNLYELISDGKIKVKKRPLPVMEPPPIAIIQDEEPQIISLCRFSRKVPHMFCSLPKGVCKIVSSPNRLRQFDLHGRLKL